MCDEQRQCEHPSALAYDSARQRRFEYLRTNDTTLNPNVGYAKHAISIDENRADFKRVTWSPTAEKQDQRDAHRNLYFEQVWLACAIFLSIPRAGNRNRRGNRAHFKSLILRSNPRPQDYDS